MLAGKTKTVTLSVPVDGSKTNEWEYQVCFAAPYQFPAMVLANDGEDTDALFQALYQAISSDSLDAAWDDSVGQYVGLLLPCGLVCNQEVLAPVTAANGTGTVTSPAPCIERPVTFSDGFATIVVRTPAADPGARW